MQRLLVSIVIPAYQQEKLIGETLKSLSAYLNEHATNSEIIVVCDGCTDDTAKMALKAVIPSKTVIRVIQLAQNKGKGNAVKVGVQEAKGEFVIFTDADLSFAPNLIEEFLQILKGGADIVIAQRKKTITYSGRGRRIFAVCSRFLVGNFLLPGIRDSQAGFKAFSRKAAEYLFSRMRTSRFLFDLEILIIARRKKYLIEKVYVDWQDKPGSTVNIIIDPLRCLRDLLSVYISLLSGRYD